jgi:hypothetical protein
MIGHFRHMLIQFRNMQENVHYFAMHFRHIAEHFLHFAGLFRHMVEHFRHVIIFAHWRKSIAR